MSVAGMDAYQSLVDQARQIALLSSIEALLGWDERTKLPAAAGPYRAEQMTYLAGLVHQRQTDPRIGQWLDELSDSPLADDPHSKTGATIRWLRRQYEKKIRLPQLLVEELTRTSVLGQQAWQIARKQNEFAGFAPLLAKTIELKRQEAEALGYDESPYDALLDEYEPFDRTSNVAPVLHGLREALVPLIEAIAESGRRPNLDNLTGPFPIDAQEAFGKKVAAEIGFDFQRGRLDETHHPFCSPMGPHDTRITTRYDGRHFNNAFFSILHEAGHGIYEQGLPTEAFGLPTGEATSLGIHESQSRLWENFVGRSRAFWEHFYGDAQKTFGLGLAHVSLDDFYFAINDVRPSMIRVEADEATYNLHILVRFELEQELIAGDLSVAELPTAWNEKYGNILGIQPQHDAEGVLQDIHWSAGLVGYFPTYALGNLYAAQFFEKADADVGGLDEAMLKGEFAPLSEWLGVNIHRHGQRYTAAELVTRVTGKPLGHDALMRHLRKKLGPLYDVV